MGYGSGVFVQFDDMTALETKTYRDIYENGVLVGSISDFDCGVSRQGLIGKHTVIAKSNGITATKVLEILKLPQE